MKVTVKLNAFYMVTFRNGAFRAIIGWRVVDYIRAQRERAERGIEVGGDIVSMYELPDGYIVSSDCITERGKAEELQELILNTLELLLLDEE